ncbi:dTDP-4-dehydrorhamnose reductase [Sphaerisporangium corydalis]|uniref:dTDP-4-dehydrorhamnose reductase n=1 Tax=Sphaerisporangium corydalis TaxID=1441875 RepID=A0ABV9EH82_9ACTN|nr:dTDP-4-dehydrorhamnose reductase [Sphaerisporangium corydalis]
MNRLLVTGAAGMLATDLLAVLAADPAAPDVLAYDRDHLDLRQSECVRDVIQWEKPDVVINCAAWTAVDDAEAREAVALAVNGDGVRALALACAEAGARLIHLSTDYVFDGTATTPYAEDAPTSPANAYGRGKLAGERAVLDALPETGYVVRTAWLYGSAGTNFVRKMISLEGRRDTVEVVDDQLGQPTWSADLAGQLVRLARAGAPPGVYHGTSSGQATWYELAREVFTLLGADPGRVRPTTAAAFAAPAVRPAYSVLGHDRWAAAGLAPIRHWRDALHAAWPSMVGGPA